MKSLEHIDIHGVIPPPYPIESVQPETQWPEVSFAAELKQPIDFDYKAYTAYARSAGLNNTQIADFTIEFKPESELTEETIFNVGKCAIYLSLNSDYVWSNRILAFETQQYADHLNGYTDYNEITTRASFSALNCKQIIS